MHSPACPTDRRRSVSLVIAAFLLACATPRPAPTSDLPDFDAEWSYEDPAATEKVFRELLAAHSGAPADWRLELTTQVARTEGLQRRFEDAHRTLDGVEAQLEGAAARTRVRYLLERGRVFNSSKDVEAARPLFLEAWNAASDAGEEGLAVDAAHMLGIVEKGDTSVSWNEKALALARSSKDPSARKWRGSLLNNLGWTYHDAGEYERALALFREALEVREAAGKPLPVRVARWCVARALRSLGLYQEALAEQEALLAEHEAAGSEDGYVYEELGECHLALGNDDTAQGFFTRAHEVLSRDAWLQANESERLERLERLGAGEPVDAPEDSASD